MLLCHHVLCKCDGIYEAPSLLLKKSNLQRGPKKTRPPWRHAPTSSWRRCAVVWCGGTPRAARQESVLRCNTRVVAPAEQLSQKASSSRWRLGRRRACAASRLRERIRNCWWGTVGLTSAARRCSQCGSGLPDVARRGRQCMRCLYVCSVRKDGILKFEKYRPPPKPNPRPPLAFADVAPK